MSNKLDKGRTVTKSEAEQEHWNDECKPVEQRLVIIQKVQGIFNAKQYMGLTEELLEIMNPGIVWNSSPNAVELDRETALASLREDLEKTKEEILDILDKWPE